MISCIRPAAIRGAAWCALSAAVAGLAWLEPGDAHAQPASTAAACTPLPPTEKYREVARKYVAEIETIEKLNGDKNRLLQLLDQLAFTYIDLNEFEQSVSVLEKALTVRGAMPGAAPKGLADNLVHLGIMQRAVARTAQAEATLARCLHVSEQHFGPDAPETAGCLAYLGALNSDAGRYGSAEPLLNRALGIYERHPAASLYPNLGNVLLLSGTHYLRLANYGLAEKFYRRNVEYREKTLGTCHPRFATSLDELAAVYHETGRFDLALPLRRRAFDIMEKIRPPDHYSTAIGLSELGFTLAAVGDYEAAEPLLTRGLDLTAKAFGRQHWRTVRALWFRVRLYEISGRYAEMETLVQRGLHDSSAIHTPEYLWRFQNAYSTIMRQRGQYSGAVYFGKQAVNTIQTLRGNLTAFDRESQRLYLTDEKSAVYRGLADLMIEEGRLSEAQQVLAMLKEEEFFDFIRRDGKEDPRATRPTFTGAEEPWTKRQAEFGSRAAALGAQRDELERKRKPGITAAEEGELKRIDAELGAVRKSFVVFLDDLLKEMNQLDDKRRAQVEARQLDVERVEQYQDDLRALGHGAVLLHYVVLPDKVRIILSTANAQTGYSSAIEQAALNQKIQAFREALQYPREDPRPVGRELFQVLLGPLAADLKRMKAQTLILSLDGVLRYVPFAALHDGERYLIQDYRITMVTQAADVRLAAAPSGAPGRFAGLGLTQQVPGFDPLPAVKEELESILKTERMQGEIYLDEAFTAERMKQALATRVAFLHVASHFVFKPGTETESFLLLGDKSRLSLRDLRVAGFNFRGVELLTLSACETAVGGGSDANGREVEGLGVMAQQRGARAVLATLWPVADASTGVLMQHFYRLRVGQVDMTKAEALRQAQVALLTGQHGKPMMVPGSGVEQRGAARADRAPRFILDPKAPYAHPYFWAPFILMGNWL